jgi:hypothetical protein
MIHRLRVIIWLAGSLSLALALCFALLGIASGGSVVPTNTWIDIYGANSTYLGSAVPISAYIAVFDAQGIQCGGFTVTKAGAYGIVPCYGDDAATPDVDEGAEVGDVLRFTIDGSPARSEVVSIDGAPVPSTTLVTWTASKNLWQVNLHAPLTDTQQTLRSSVNPATLGESIAFSTTVTSAVPGGPTPTGVVHFRADATALAGPVALVGGNASISTSALAAGVHTITVEYGGDAVYAPSAASLPQIVLPYEELCGLAEVSYDFSASGHVRVEIGALGTLDCLQVHPVLGNHPYATAGIATGQYWLISGTTGLGDPAGGFSVTLTLPALFAPDAGDKLCRYIGPGFLWQCAANSFSAVSGTISLAGVNGFSTWAVGSDVGANAVALTDLEARPLPASPHIPLSWVWLGLVATVAAVAWARAGRSGFRRSAPQKDIP